MNSINASIITKNSGDRDFNEINTLIKYKVTEANTSLNSKTQQTITENSIISNLDNWLGNVSQDDSKQFESKFKEIKSNKINDGTFPKLKMKINKANEAKPKTSSNKNLRKQSSKDCIEKIKFNLNCNVYIPNKSKPVLVTTKQPNLQINVHNDEFDEKRTEVGIQAYSKSFVNPGFSKVSSQLIQHTQSEENTPSNPQLYQIEYMNKISPLFSSSTGCQEPNIGMNYLNNYASNYSGTTISCTPKHQKFVSDHSITIKPSLDSLNIQQEDKFICFPEIKNLTPTNLFNNKFELINNFKSKAQMNDQKSIIVENILSGKDKRTTIMLRNIPLKYTISNLVDELNSQFAGKFDFVNMPINLDVRYNQTKLNLGYSFINFTDPFHIILFSETFQDRQWQKYKSDKKTSVNYAEKQGKKEYTLKDDTIYYAANDPKVSQKLKTALIEIPIKYYEAFKRILPHSDPYFPKHTIKKQIPVFVVKKIY